MSKKKDETPKRLTNDELAQRVFGEKVVREVKKAVRESDGDEDDEEPNDHEQKVTDS